VVSFNKLILLAGALACGTLAACSSDSGTNPSADPTTRITVNAAGTDPVYLLLGNPATISTSSNWDLSFSQLTIDANGGASGSGNVSVYCASATCTTPLSDAQVLALTSTNGLAMFDSITAANIPTDTTKFLKDQVALAVTGWVDYLHGPPAANVDSVWSIKLASTSGATAKFHVTEITFTSGTGIAFQWAVQPSGQTTVGSDQTGSVSLTAGSTSYVNLSTGAVTAGTAPTTWDIAFQYVSQSAGYTILLNDAAGVRASSVGSFLTGGYASMTSATTIGGVTLPSDAYSADGTGGAFSTYEWYKYDIDPANPHTVVPTYNVYIVKRGGTYYKVQIISFYGAGGDNSGTAYHLVVRYAPLAVNG
jgi:hypothetical protein